jgi:hypothetical protein
MRRYGVLHSSASEGVRAMCVQILEEYRVANADPSFLEWLRSGAPSDDDREDKSRHQGAARGSPGGKGRE